MTLGQRIRSIRKKHKLSILDLKNITGLSKSTISEIENDKSNPTTDTLSKIAKALNVNIEEFFREDLVEEQIDIPKEYSDKFKVTKRDKDQYKEFLKKEAQGFFMNDEFDEEDKKEILDIMNEIFWEAKALNKRKPKK
ncbi:helix-turn-helix domain-containing protein [Clostridium drakei]|uniref:Transcriptional regulator n=1 Tax=Clostridium drakei TaxID=332101 RepID=A0A2U8DMT7_9CLOT|nr:helix-turn-helix transcriptional regulator [Clostridium drakei]AWI04049.1 transcriptional regulator [Clostridium drakei]